MIPALRERFNAAWTPAAYARLQAIVTAMAGVPLSFTVSETPCFFPAELLDEMAATGAALVDGFLADPRARAEAEALIPTRYLGPGQEAAPTFVQVDFGIIRTARGEHEPRLVELQAFPSLYGFQYALGLAHH
ncbi:MAG TPA: hypothetical protein VMW48_17155, partial [Vicinamibacterales bacterium]|nr:hypothetical protein [Vicinamibacterales bacterium]